MTIAYPIDKLRDEVTFIAYHLHWSLSEILELPHSERVAWVGRISKLNQKILDSQS